MRLGWSSAPLGAASGLRGLPVPDSHPCTTVRPTWLGADSGLRGSLVLGYGPDASLEESQLLLELQDQREPGH